MPIHRCRAEIEAMLAAQRQRKVAARPALLSDDVEPWWLWFLVGASIGVIAGFVFGRMVP